MREQRACEKRVRAAFWIIGTILGGVLAYLTRYYLNTDGLIYLEIGDAARHGNWSALVNHQWSPAYSVFMGVAQALLDSTPYNELTRLKIVNFLSFVFAMGMCDVFLVSLRAAVSNEYGGKPEPAPFRLLRLVIYCAFLVAALVWIRVRLVSPDMLMLGYLLLSASLILRIKTNPPGYANFVGLGCVLGLAYLTKTYMFVYSGIILVLAGFAVGSLRRAVPRAGLALVIMMAISLPFILALSRDLGRFTYGEAGNYNYALFVASEGEPVNPPAQLTTKPAVLLFEETPHSCFSPGADIAKRSEGKRPRFDLNAQLKAVERNLWIIVSDSPWFWLSVMFWSLVQLKWARPRLGSMLPVSEGLMLLTASVSGILLFLLVLVEMRYVAPFLFLGVAGLALIWRYKPLDAREGQVRDCAYYALCVVFLSFTAWSAIDQALRATTPSGSKPSYEAVFREDTAMANYISGQKNLSSARGAIVDSHSMSIYWARLAGVKIVAEIPSMRDYLGAAPRDREIAKKRLREHSVEFVAARGREFQTLASEGWIKVPSTSDYYLLFTGK
ncbi:MAG: hypothetical protein ACP5LD_12545 [Desulfomonilaceae bacterium]